MSRDSSKSCHENGVAARVSAAWERSAVQRQLRCSVLKPPWVWEQGNQGSWGGRGSAASVPQGRGFELS